MPNSDPFKLSKINSFHNKLIDASLLKFIFVGFAGLQVNNSCRINEESKKEKADDAWSW